MKKPNPINKESPFKHEEFFFSTTDNRGVIEYGNDVFVRISGYKREELMGKPHNIIRHPDMPKCVFKVFWDTLKSGSPIAAYVKNLAADGSFYWVFAFAFPVASGGYLSIRFKPSSPVFKIVQDLYNDLLRVEKAGSMEEAETHLFQKLKTLGFEDYHQFMVHAAVTELNSLEQFLRNKEHVQTNDRLNSTITSVKEETVSAINKSFTKIDSFETSSKTFTSTIKLLEMEFKKLKFLSVNMSILANKFGSDAASLSVISEHFSGLANQIENQLVTFSKFTGNLLKVIERCSLELVALKTQMNMVDFFVKESISKNMFDEMISNKDIFSVLFAQSSENLLKEITKLTSESITIEGQIAEIQKFINGLEIVKQTGAIESARKDNVKAAFGVYLQEMNAFTAILRDSIDKLSKARTNLYYNANEIQDSTRGMRDNVEDLFKLVMQRNKAAA